MSSSKDPSLSSICRGCFQIRAICRPRGGWWTQFNPLWELRPPPSGYRVRLLLPHLDASSTPGDTPRLPQTRSCQAWQASSLGAWGRHVQPPHVGLVFAPTVVSAWALPVTHWAGCRGGHRGAPPDPSIMEQSGQCPAQGTEIGRWG